MSNVYVYLWFDIEDYVTKESHELPLIAFNILKKHNIPVTCKIVAEKIRALKENGRDDVIDAISGYDVGYHLDTHSQHPTLYEYMADLDIRSGSKDFLTREGIGFQYVKEIFARTPSCFGHPGPTWAPHVYPALSEMGVQVYLDETPILNLDDQPYWYCGILNLNGANRNFICCDFTFENPNSLSILKRKFKTTYDRLQRGEGGALSILFHLHTAINRKFWDEVNFDHGMNRSRDQYQRPPSQPEEITKRAWENFEALINFMKEFKDVKFITATDALKIYPRNFPTELAGPQLKEITKHFSSSTDYLKSNNLVLSASEGFYVTTYALNEYALTGTLPKRLEVKEPYGPMALYHGKRNAKIQSLEFLASARHVLEHLDSEKCIPTSIRVNDKVSLGPQDYLVTSSRLLTKLQSGKRLPESLALSRGEPPHKKLISPSKFRKACKWKVLPRNFTAPKMLEQIRCQTWTLKPALQARELI